VVFIPWQQGIKNDNNKKKPRREEKIRKMPTRQIGKYMPTTTIIATTTMRNKR